MAFDISSNRFASLDESPSPTVKTWSHKITTPIVQPFHSPDIIHVGHRLALTDTQFTTPVKRDTSVHDLANLPPAKTLQEHTGGNIVVSPARPAQEDTEVRVEATIAEIMSRMKKEMTEEICKKLKADLGDRVATAMAELNENLRMLSKAHGIRNVEDWCIKRMVKLLGIHDDETITTADVVDRFLNSFTFGGVTKGDIESLKHSKGRQMANEVIRIKYGMDGIEDMARVWKFLKPSLEGADASRYERLYKFCTGTTPANKKN